MTVGGNSVLGVWIVNNKLRSYWCFRRCLKEEAKRVLQNNSAFPRQGTEEVIEFAVGTVKSMVNLQVMRRMEAHSWLYKEKVCGDVIRCNWHTNSGNSEEPGAKNKVTKIMKI